MLKAVLFDFDGVLTLDRTGSGPLLKYIAGVTKIPVEILEREYYKYNEDLLDGKITHKDMWQIFCDGVGREIDEHILIDAFHHIAIDSAMVELVKELRKQNLKTAMVTDNKYDRIDEIFKYYHLYELFDVVSISALIGSGKKHKPIFVETLKKLEVSPEECIFIDNTPGNLVVPEPMGIHTILFDDELRPVEEVKEEILSCL